MIYANGGEYVGEWDKGRRDGQGIMTYANGNKFVGKWSYDEYSEGVLTFANGNKYEGKWDKGGWDSGRAYRKAIFYRGTILYKDDAGNQYEGEYYRIARYTENPIIADSYHGQGAMRYANGDVYIGWWSYGKKSGSGALNGTMNYANGDFYIGAWIADKKTRGTMNYANGDVYIGSFDNDKKSGTGRMKYANGDEYFGRWENDLPIDNRQSK